jgi:hypothetical protein
METNTTYTITFSDFVYCDFRRRGMLSEMEDMGLVTIKRNKRTATISINERVREFCMADIEYQIDIIEMNGVDRYNNGTLRIYRNALTKFELATPV